MSDGGKGKRNNTTTPGQKIYCMTVMLVNENYELLPWS